MSDIKKLELRNVMLAVRDVTKWHDLGLQLGLADATLALIATYPDIEGHLRMMLAKWLRSDTEASWEKLADALSIIGEKVAAENVRRHFIVEIPIDSRDHVTIRKQPASLLDCT